MTDSLPYSRVHGWLSIKRHKAEIRQRAETIPEEYLPWLSAVSHFVDSYVDRFDDMRRRGKHKGEGSLALAHLVLGIVQAFTEIHGLTWGQQRHLSIEVLARAGFSYPDSISLFDVSRKPARYLPDDLAYAANEAVTIGFHMGMNEWKGTWTAIDELVEQSLIGLHSFSADAE